jgi:6,7-dimethyl-8-ribityllumazine synthase
MQQALERAGIKSNKGWEYAMNAIEMANLMRQIQMPNHGTTLNLKADIVNAIGTASINPG